MDSEAAIKQLKERIAQLEQKLEDYNDIIDDLEDYKKVNERYIKHIHDMLDDYEATILKLSPDHKFPEPTVTTLTGWNSE